MRAEATLVTWNAINAAIIAFLIVAAATATLVTHRKYGSVALTAITSVAPMAIIAAYMAATAETYSFSYNDTHLTLRLVNQIYIADLERCEKLWIEEPRVMVVHGVEVAGTVAGLLEVVGVGRGYGMVIDDPRHVLFIRCGDANYVIGATGLKPSNAKP